MATPSYLLMLMLEWRVLQRERNTAINFGCHRNKNFHLLQKASKEIDMLSVKSVWLISQSSIGFALALITVEKRTKRYDSASGTARHHKHGNN